MIGYCRYTFFFVRNSVLISSNICCSETAGFASSVVYVFSLLPEVSIYTQWNSSLPKTYSRGTIRILHSVLWKPTEARKLEAIALPDPRTLLASQKDKWWNSMEQKRKAKEGKKSVVCIHFPCVKLMFCGRESSIICKRSCSIPKLSTSRLNSQSFSSML